MDSSRSGLLSTLLMTLPLIVVPAIALLRPPGQTSGVSTAPLDAADLAEEIFPDDFKSEDDSPADAQSKSPKESAKNIEDEFGGLFGEAPSEAVDDEKIHARSKSLLLEEIPNPFDSPDVKFNKEECLGHL